MLRPSLHMLSGFGWCGADLLPFPNHSATITGVSDAATGSSPGGCGRQSVLIFFAIKECRVNEASLLRICSKTTVLFATWIQWSAVLPDGWLGLQRGCLHWPSSIGISDCFWAGFWLPGKWRLTGVAVVCLAGRSAFISWIPTVGWYPL